MFSTHGLFLQKHAVHSCLLACKAVQASTYTSEFCFPVHLFVHTQSFYTNSYEDVFTKHKHKQTTTGSIAFFLLFFSFFSLNAILIFIYFKPKLWKEILFSGYFLPFTKRTVLKKVFPFSFLRFFSSFISYLCFFFFS